MPITLDQNLINHLVDRQVRQEQMVKGFDKSNRGPVVDMSEPVISPEKLLKIGGLIDAISTYTFLKKGSGTEENPLLAPMRGNPLATGAAVGGVSLAVQEVSKLLGKKWPKLNDAFRANQGGLQLFSGVTNFDNRKNLTADEIWTNTLGEYRRQKLEHK